MKQLNLYTGSVRLIDKRTRAVELLGPEPPGTRRPTDRQLLFWAPQASWEEFTSGPRSVGVCYAAEGRTAKFLVDKSVAGERLLDLLSKYPDAPARPARPYGLTGFLIDG